MVGLGKEELLQSQRHRNVVGKPVGAASDLPEIVVAASAHNFDCQIVDHQAYRRIRPFGIQLGYELAGPGLDPTECVAKFPLDLRLRNNRLQTSYLRSQSRDLLAKCGGLVGAVVEPQCMLKSPEKAPCAVEMIRRVACLVGMPLEAGDLRADPVQSVEHLLRRGALS